MTCSGHIFSLRPFFSSHPLTGKLAAKPKAMPICIMNPKTGFVRAISAPKMAGRP